jgi:hypothetical protein
MVFSTPAGQCPWKFNKNFAKFQKLQPFCSISKDYTILYRISEMHCFDRPAALARYCLLG